MDQERISRYVEDGKTLIRAVAEKTAAAASKAVPVPEGPATTVSCPAPRSTRPSRSLDIDPNTVVRATRSRWACGR